MSEKKAIKLFIAFFFCAKIHVVNAMYGIIIVERGFL